MHSMSDNTQFLVTDQVAKVKYIQNMPTIGIMNEQLGNTPRAAK